MNKEQLLELINSKIAGQGSAVDIGGALAPVLTELVTNLANVHTTYIAQISSFQEVEIPENVLDSIQMGDQLILKMNMEEPAKVEMTIVTNVMVGNIGGVKQVVVQWFTTSVDDKTVSFAVIEAHKDPETGWTQSLKTGDATIN